MRIRADSFSQFIANFAIHFTLYLFLSLMLIIQYSNNIYLLYAITLGSNLYTVKLDSILVIVGNEYNYNYLSNEYRYGAEGCS